MASSKTKNGGSVRQRPSASKGSQGSASIAKVKDAASWKRDLFIVLLLFLGAVVGLMSFLKYFVFAHVSSVERDAVVLPTNLQEVQKLGKFLESYSARHPMEVFVGHAACYLFLQTFAIPGTIFFNLLGGALYGVTLGYPLCLLYNTVGSVFLYLLSKLFGHNLITHFFEDKMEELRRKLDAHRGDLVWYMTSMRIFPFTPNWFMNVSAPHLHIPVSHFSLAIMMGLTPYNFLSCKAGVILGELRSKSEIMDRSTTLQLVAIAILGFMVPRLLKGRVAKGEESTKRRQ